MSAPDKSFWTAHSGGVLVDEPTRLTGRGKAAVIAWKSGTQVSDSGRILKTGGAGLQGPYTEARLCTLRHSRVSCLLITLSSSSASASLSRSITPISGPAQGVDRGSGQAPNE